VEEFKKELEKGITFWLVSAGWAILMVTMIVIRRAIRTGDRFLEVLAERCSRGIYCLTKREIPFGVFHVTLGTFIAFAGVITVTGPFIFIPYGAIIIVVGLVILVRGCHFLLRRSVVIIPQNS